MRVDWKRFGSKLKEMREAADLGLREAARDAEIGHSTWCRAEQGKVISVPHYLGICAWMNIHPQRYFIWAKRKKRGICHCGKDGHPMGSMNCPVHGYATIPL